MPRMILALAGIAAAFIFAGCQGQGQALVAQAAEPEKKPAEDKKQPEVLAEFKIERGGRLILVPVKIEGKEYPFAIDTGSSVCMLDPLFKPKKSLFEREPDQAPQKVTLVTASGKADFEVASPPDLFLGNLDLREAGQACWMDFELLRRVTGRDVRGILGMSFLKRHVVRIDFEGGTLQLLPSDGRSRPEWGSPLDICAGPLKDCPYVRGNFAGVGEADFLIDIGYNGAMSLGPEEFDKVADQTAVCAQIAATAAGVEQLRVARTDNLVFGGSKHRRLIIDEGTSRSIGQGLLARYVVTFDFPKSRMYLQKGKNFARVDEVDMSGLHLWVVDKKVAVHSVDKESPAEKASIKPEDVVLQVGAQRAAEMDIEGLRDLLKSGDGKEIIMTIKHGEEEKAVSFKLKKRL